MNENKRLFEKAVWLLATLQQSISLTSKNLYIYSFNYRLSELGRLFVRAKKTQFQSICCVYNNITDEI